MDSSLDSDCLWLENKQEKAIALTAVRALHLGRGRAMLEKDLPVIHGVAVWCLVSGDNDEVQYHIDYGELHRYETNTIFPPVYAGTCHISPIYTQEDMVGGEFSANIEGIEHYKKFGYKCTILTILHVKLLALWVFYCNMEQVDCPVRMRLSKI